MKMAELFSSVRARIKAKEGKYMPVVWSPNVYRIKRRVLRNLKTSRNKYILVNIRNNMEILRLLPNGQYYRTRNFWASDLLPVELDDLTLIMTNDEALLLNGCKRTRTDMVHID